MSICIYYLPATFPETLYRFWLDPRFVVAFTLLLALTSCNIDKMIATVDGILKR